MRKELLSQYCFNFITALGEEAWQSFGDRGPLAALMIIDNASPPVGHRIGGVDALHRKSIARKITEIRDEDVRLLSQAGQLKNPDARLALDEAVSFSLLASIAFAHKGITTNDDPQFVQRYWEHGCRLDGWDYYQSTVERHEPYGGRSDVILFEGGAGRLRKLAANQDRDRRRDKQGLNAWGRTQCH